MRNNLRRLTLGYVLLLFCLISSATVPSKNILHGQWSLEEVKKMLVLHQKWVDYPAYSDRAGWDALFGESKDRVIANGEKYIDFEWKVVKATDYIEYQRSGNRVIMQNSFTPNTHAIGQLFMAEMAEGKGRFMDPLINGIFHMCEMSSWALSAHLVVQPSRRSIPSYDFNYVDIVAGDISNMMSWAYYFLHEEFDKIEPEISRRLYHELDRRVMTPYLTQNFWWMSAGTNWNAWTNSNMLLTFMLLENDRDRLAEGVYKTMACIDKFFNYINEDGACEEGPNYWNMAHAKAFEYLEMIKKITNGGIDLFDMPKIRRMGEYIVHTFIGNNWMVNFADGSAKGAGEPYIIYRFGKATHSQLMQNYAKNQIKEGKRIGNPSIDIYRYLGALKVQKELHTNPVPYEIEPMIWYPQTQVCYMRNDKAMLAAKGGHNDEAHNHNDVGSFIFAVNSTPLLIDAGVGTYNGKTFSSQRYTIWNMQSLYHNVPAINGMAQKYGRTYRAYNCKAKNTHFEADIARAYPAEAKVKSWIRSYDLKKNELVIKDKFSLEKCIAPSSIHFLTRGQVSIDGGNIQIEADGQQATLLFDHKAFTATCETINLKDPSHVNVWGKEIYRLCLTPKKMTKSGTYSFKVRF